MAQSSKPKESHPLLDGYPSDERIAELIFQLSCLDRHGLFEAINVVHEDVARALQQVMEEEPERFKHVFARVAKMRRISEEKQKQIKLSIEFVGML
jgi:hypothetical protein